MREQQLKELMEQQVARTRNDGEVILDTVARRLRQQQQQANEPGQQGAGGLRNAPVAPGAPNDPRRAAEPLPNRPGNPGSQATATAPATQPSGQAAQGPGAQQVPALSRETVQELPKLVADFQRQNGLPVTGRIDQNTLATLKDQGMVLPQPSSSTNANAKPEPAQRERATKEDVTATRLTRAAAEQQAKKRLDAPIASTRSDRLERNDRNDRNDRAQAPAGREGAPSTPIDRALDPSRLLASLALAGFIGQGKNPLEDAVKSFQSAHGLPVTGKVDAQTAEALKKDGVVDPHAAEAPSKPTQSDKPVEAKQQVRRALSENAPTTKNAADRDVAKDPLRPQASTNQQTTTSDVAARAPVTASEAQAQAQAALEKARLDTVVAQQVANERGVQEGKGDPKATQGHGEVAGEGAGQKGKGGVSGGGTLDSTATTHAMSANADVAGIEGDETAVGNAEAGDDDFNNDERGNANMGDGDEDAPPADDIGEHWQVPPLSEQVRAALEKVARDDDGAGPVTYTWDVTFLRPGTYASGQPAEELWHVAVHKATAFDPVWQKAADAIASRMLYTEPDGEPPTIDDFILALRRARVR